MLLWTLFLSYLFTNNSLTTDGLVFLMETPIFEFGNYFVLTGSSRSQRHTDTNIRLLVGTVVVRIVTE